ncbi:MAG: hydantoinase B/oxoprolinase family protein, partial [Actinobacteria bacterium]|nr:hydantoinase B/oxoprolinase family protein [Actinomycetota bacterium]
MVQIDPIRYELYRHRLFNILEEGRIAMRMVSGSPVVVEGGETMSAIYMSDGTPILVAAGILLHCVGAKDFIAKTIEMYDESPGIHEGDQIFFNDPYVGGQHLCDQAIIKPIFYKGERIAWVGSIMHTSETGGIAPGGMPPYATEIYQEGIRISGLKIVEGGQFRNDVYNTIVRQVRDQTLVGLDINAKIASNNVCANAFLELVEKYGIDFISEANDKIIRDSELEARQILSALPDGTWKSRHYGDHNGLEEIPFRVVCTVTKKGDHITFDYTGTSPQSAGSLNSTFPATWGSLFVVLASSLFWNVSWNGGMFRPVELVAPEGSVVNCTYPAACSTGVASVG